MFSSVNLLPCPAPASHDQPGGYHSHDVAKDAKYVLEGAGIVTLAILLDGVVCYLFDRGDPQC